MLSDVRTSRNTEHLFTAMRYVGAHSAGGMVVYTSAPICVFIGLEKLVHKQIMPVRFVHDKNWPKVAVDDLDSEGFHTEFSVNWQQFRFHVRNKLLAIQGVSERFPTGYKIHVHLRGKRVSRNA